MKRFLAGALVLVTIFATGCPPVNPKTARDAVVFAYGFILDLQDKNGVACQMDSAQAKCVTINRAVAIQRLAATTLNEYCAGPALPGEATYLDGGACSVQAGVEGRLNAALVDLDSIMKDIKVLAGGN